MIRSFVLLCFAVSLYAKLQSELPVSLKQNVHILTKTVFETLSHQSGKSNRVDLSDRDFILVSVREKGSDGRFYAVDRDGTVWLSGPISSGAPHYRTPSGIFRILEKRRRYMSRRYPDTNGVNNMDFMMRFTRWGHALHKGDVRWLSHGCIHVSEKDVIPLYRWAYIGMPIVITRERYMPFAKSDLLRIYAD